MDPEVFLDVANKVSRLKMYPYFTVTHFILMCITVRDDVQPPHGPQFARKHPLACWAACMVTCFGGGMLVNFLLGEAVLTPFKNQEDVLLASFVWYLVFYSPFDLFYKLARLTPVWVTLWVLKEIDRARRLQNGVMLARDIYPNSALLMVIAGVCTGSGSAWVKNVQRLMRGVWKPNENNLLNPALFVLFLFVSKASLIAAVCMVCQLQGLLRVPMPALYLAIIIFFLYFRLTALFFGIQDPSAPIENLLCAILLGGTWEALQRAWQRRKGAVENGKLPQDDKKTN